MKLHIAGGCGEHGRNCFHIIGDSISFLVDCGIMASDDSKGMPHLDPDEIRKLKYVFLTHSHADHTGALPRLISNGFEGSVIASSETLKQLPVMPSKTLLLEDICPGGHGLFDGIRITWGRSGHCIGSVWYHMETEGKKILFSGDYCEDTLIHNVDTIRNLAAEIAVIDCAYGTDCTEFRKYATSVLWQVQSWLKRPGETVILPVPGYGRGMELLNLFLSNNPDLPVYGDIHFIEQSAKSNDHYWYKSSPFLCETGIKEINDDSKGLIFISDPQLRSPHNRNTVKSLLSKGARVLLTGTAEKNSFSSMLLQQGKASFIRYPVHQNLKQFQKLETLNNFSFSIPYHSPEFRVDDCYDI